MFETVDFWIPFFKNSVMWIETPYAEPVNTPFPFILDLIFMVSLSSAEEAENKKCLYMESGTDGQIELKWE